MKEFEVTITETLQKSITVEAATREEAQAMVEEMWDKGDVVLDADHFVSAEFSCNDGQEIEADKAVITLRYRCRSWRISKGFPLVLGRA